jgi:hypothetical protein
MEFAFAGLHQLLAPMLDRLEPLPVPQRDALLTVFGISAGPGHGPVPGDTCGDRRAMDGRHSLQRPGPL